MYDVCIHTSECCGRNYHGNVKMLEISGDTVLERQSEEDAHEQDEGEQLEGKSMEEIEVIKGVKEIEKNKRDLEIDKSIATFLRDKGLSENLVKTLINAGLTDEHVRLTDSEVDKLHRYFSYINQNCVIYNQNVIREITSV